MLSIRHFFTMLTCGSALCSLAGQATVQELTAYYLDEANKLFIPASGDVRPLEKPLSNMLFSTNAGERKKSATLLYNSLTNILDSIEQKTDISEIDRCKPFSTLTRSHFFSGCAHFLRYCRDLTDSEELMGDEIRSMFNVDTILVLDLSSLARAEDSNFSDDAKLLAQLGLSYLSEPQSLTDEQKQQLQNTWETYTDQWMEEMSDKGTKEIVSKDIITPYQKYFSGEPADSPIISTPSFFANVLAFFECRHESLDGVRLFHDMEDEDSKRTSSKHGKAENLIESIDSSRRGGPKISYSNSSTTAPITHSVTLLDRRPKKRSKKSTKKTTEPKTQTQEQVFQYSDWKFKDCSSYMTEQDDLSHEFGHIFQRSICVPNDRLTGMPNLLSLNHVVPALFSLKEGALLYIPHDTLQKNARESNFSNYNSLFTDSEPTQHIRPWQILFDSASEISNMFGGSVLPGRLMTKNINGQDTKVREKILVVFPHCELIQRREANLPWRKSHTSFADPKKQQVVNKGIIPHQDNINRYINFMNEVKKSELELLKNS